MRVAIIGKGNVGKALGPNIAAAGHDVVFAVRNPHDPKYASEDGTRLKSLGEAASDAELIILAVNWSAVDDALRECGDMNGKVLIDCTNPYDFRNNLAPLVPADQSAAEIIASKTSARVVKAFNQVGAEVMANARVRKARPLQFVASDHQPAKKAVIELASEIGFDARDAGGLAYARELEGMARLWIAQAFWGGMPLSRGWLLSTE